MSVLVHDVACILHSHIHQSNVPCTCTTVLISAACSFCRYHLFHVWLKYPCQYIERILCKVLVTLTVRLSLSIIFVFCSVWCFPFQMICQWPLLLLWFNWYFVFDKRSHLLYLESNYSPMASRQRQFKGCWISGMEQYYTPPFYMDPSYTTGREYRLWHP